MPLITRAAVLAFAAATSMACAVDATTSQNRQRIYSTDGFSFLPPQGSSWTEEFGKNQITYLKKTDPDVVSFYAGALEGKLQTKLTTNEELVAFVRSKKDQWGNDDRFSDPKVSFEIEKKENSCVRYRMSAHDQHAKNKGQNSFLVLLAVGRFCLHPKIRASAVDVYYSVRYSPTFDPKELVAEGEAFLNSLAFHNPQ